MLKENVIYFYEWQTHSKKGQVKFITALKAAHYLQFFFFFRFQVKQLSAEIQKLLHNYPFDFRFQGPNPLIKENMNPS